jgi:hypothetical protein
VPFEGTQWLCGTRRSGRITGNTEVTERNVRVLPTMRSNAAATSGIFNGANRPRSAEEFLHLDTSAAVDQAL